MNTISSQHTRKPKGFTLIELVFATAILGFMLTITLTTFIGVFRFYVWAGTTRTNQESARQVMDVMSREIASKKIVSSRDPSVICLADPTIPNPTVYDAIVLAGSQIEKRTYTNDQCNEGDVLVEVISNQNLRVSVLNFVIINGALNNPLGGNLNPKRALLHKSATINMTIVNSQNPGITQCPPGDNFCDVASYVTAVTERNNGL